MKIFPEQLANKLQKEPRPLVWIAGDEPLFVLERGDQVRHFCRGAGITEREVFNVDRTFDWARFIDTSSSLSLFSESRLIELRLASAKLEDEGKEALQHYLNAPNPADLVLITSPRIEAPVLKTRWFKAIDEQAWFVPVWPLSKDEMGDWLQQRLLQAGLRLTPDALALLIERVEGNLLAASQEISKLALLATPRDGGQPVILDAEAILQAVGDSARYNAFVLIDAALSGDGSRALKVLHGLRGEGTEPLAIVGALSGELRRLLAMARNVQSGQSIGAVVDQARVNFKRKAIVSGALRRIGPQQLYSLLDQARSVDYAVKGLNPNDPWLSLEVLLLSLSGIAVPALQRAG